MREKWQKQIPLMAHILDHPQSQELEVISGIIDANSTICQYILQDLNTGKSEAQRSGAKGMSAEMCHNQNSFRFHLSGIGLPHRRL